MTDFNELPHEAIGGDDVVDLLRLFHDTELPPERLELIEAARRDVRLDQVNRHIREVPMIGQTESVYATFDPRLPAEDCECITQRHTASTVEGYDGQRQIDTLTIHVPFALRSPGAMPGIDQIYSGSELTKPGMRLAYRMSELDIAEATAVAKFHLRIWLSQQIGPALVRKAVEPMLQEAGCPDLVLKPSTSSFGF